MLPVIEPPVEGIAPVEEVCQNLPLLLCQLCATPFPKLYSHHDHLSIHDSNISHDTSVDNINSDDDVSDGDSTSEPWTFNFAVPPSPSCKEVIVDEPLLVIVDTKNGEVEDEVIPALINRGNVCSVKSKSSSTTYLPCLATEHFTVIGLPQL